MSSHKTPNRKKVSLSPLPDQKDDYSDYEETEVLWGRIALIFTAVFGTVFVALYALFYPANHSSAVVSVHETRKIEAQASAEQQILEADRAPETTAVVAAIEEVFEHRHIADRASPEDVPSVVSNLDSVEDKPDAEHLNLLAVLAPKEAATGVAMTENTVLEDVTGRSSDALISPVSTLHPGIRVASLTKGIDANRQPVDVLGYQIAMQDQNLIKVVLYTEMQDIRGVTLYHEWYQGDKRHAKVRIPVTVNKQTSFSSKYIDRHMMGEWTVRVRDEQGEMYAMANFNVIQ